MDNYKLKKLFDKYNMLEKDQADFLNYINKIYLHPEFQRRMTDEFLHHDKITLGEHILEDAIVTYQLLKKYNGSKEYDLSVALNIAMFHDLYCLPWQNNPSADVDKFIHKHGFRHPIEAIINAMNWFPEYFENPIVADKIIDGVVHHMYPFPVCSFSTANVNNLELKNFDLLKNISFKNIELLIKSCQRKKIGDLSFSKSIYFEGKIMCKSDKKVSIDNFKKTTLSSKLALLHGKNKSLKK